jgi:hypothetical protein
MVPSARRPLRVRHWDGYALVSEKPEKYLAVCSLKGPMPTTPTPIATAGRQQTLPNAMPNTTRLFEA